MACCCAKEIRIRSWPAEPIEVERHVQIAADGREGLREERHVALRGEHLADFLGAPEPRALDLLQALDDRGIGRETLTLHVGAGTFLPVKAEDTSRRTMALPIFPGLEEDDQERVVEALKAAIS